MDFGRPNAKIGWKLAALYLRSSQAICSVLQLETYNTLQNYFKHQLAAVHG